MKVSLTLTSYAALFLSVYFTDLSNNIILKIRFICHILYFILKNQHESTQNHVRDD